MTIVLMRNHIEAWNQERSKFSDSLGEHQDIAKLSFYDAETELEAQKVAIMAQKDPLALLKHQ